MKISTKNTIKLIVAAITGYGFVGSIFSMSETTDPTGSVTSAIIYFVITAALLFSVLRANKKRIQTEKEKSV